MSTALAWPAWAMPRVSLAAPPATTPSPSRETLSRLPLSTLQPRTAGLPPTVASAFAEQGPVQASQVGAARWERATMPETWTCPECQRKVRLPDHLIGKRVKCPSCGGTFTATSATVPAPAFVPAPAPVAPFEPMPAPMPAPQPPDEEQEQDDQ